MPLATSGDPKLLNPRFRSNSLHFPRPCKIWGSGRAITRFKRVRLGMLLSSGNVRTLWTCEKSNGVKDLRQMLCLWGEKTV